MSAESGSMNPPIDVSLLRLIEQAELHAMLASEAANSAPHLHACRFGATAGFINLQQHNTLFNRVIGAGEEETGEIEKIIAWYDSFGVPPRFDICPPRRGPRLSRALSRAGLEPEAHPSFSRRHMVGETRGPAQRRAHSGVEIEVRLIESDDDLRAFIDIQIEVWPEDGFTREARFAQLSASSGRADIRRYLAMIDGRAAATAALSLTPEVGWLSAGAVRDEFRRRGVQRALIARRMNDAAQAGCAHVATLVSPGSASERNLHRAGFAFACDRELWLPPDWTDRPFYRGAG